VTMVLDTEQEANQRLERITFSSKTSAYREYRSLK